MKVDYPKIKKFLQIGIFSINLLIFLLVIFSTNSSSKNYKEYTGTAVFFLDVYIIIIYGVLIFITIYPAFLYNKLKHYILFIFTDKGKAITSFLISLIFWFARNKPQFVLGILITITSLILIAYEFIFHFAKVETFLNNKGIEFSNRGQAAFDVQEYEKKTSNNITTPMSNQNNRYQSNQSDNHNQSYDNNNEGSSQQNPSSDHNQRDVEISSGFDNNPSGDNNIQNGFGF